MRLVIAQTVFAAASASFSVNWISPDALNKLSTAIAAMDAARAMSQAEIDAVTSAGYGEDVLLPILHTRVPIRDSAYLGFDWDASAISEFEQAWTRIVPDAHLACLEDFKLFWIERPHWYVASADEVFVTAMCVHAGLAALQGFNEVADAPVESGSIVATGLAEIMKPLYAPFTERWLGLPKPYIQIPDMDTKKQSFAFFQRFVRESPILLQLLREESDVVASPMSLQGANAEFATILLAGGDHPALKHAGDFLDMVWGEAVANSQGDLLLPHWLALVDNVIDFDEIELTFELSKLESVSERLWAQFTHYRSGMGLGLSAWRSSVGSVVRMLVDNPSSREAVIACLPAKADPDSSADLFYLLDDDNSMKSVVKMYRCIVDGVSAGIIPVPANPGRGHFAATVMHMARLSRGALAFILDNQA